MICIEARVRNRGAWEGLILSLKDRLASQDREIAWLSRFAWVGMGDKLPQLRRERERLVKLIRDLEERRE